MLYLGIYWLPINISQRNTHANPIEIKAITVINATERACFAINPPIATDTIHKAITPIALHQPKLPIANCCLMACPEIVSPAIQKPVHTAVTLKIR